MSSSSWFFGKMVFPVFAVLLLSDYLIIPVGFYSNIASFVFDSDVRQTVECLSRQKKEKLGTSKRGRGERGKGGGESTYSMPNNFDYYYRIRASKRQIVAILWVPNLNTRIFSVRLDCCKIYHHYFKLIEKIHSIKFYCQL